MGRKYGYKIKELNFQKGEAAGIKPTLEFEGDYSLVYLKGENECTSISSDISFDSNAKRHTSFASVYVYPLVDDSIELTSILLISRLRLRDQWCGRTKCK
jgi:peptide chain release factor 2